MEKIEEDFDFENVYNDLKKDYKLPDFLKMCEEFDIEKIIDKESRFLLREIRRIMAEKTSAYLHLFETLINPSQSSVFVFSILKDIPNQDKEKMRGIYKELAKIQIKIMKLDSFYNEDQEAIFILKTFNIWQNIKGKILNIINKFEVNFENETPVKKSSYFD